MQEALGPFLEFKFEAASSISQSLVVQGELDGKRLADSSASDTQCVPSIIASSFALPTLFEPLAICSRIAS